jgi:hypothetical protein
MKQSAITLDPQRAQPERLSFLEALVRWLMDANKWHVVNFFRVFLLVLAGYAPFAALNDSLAPLAFGIPLLDDWEIPLGILAALKIYFEVRKYQDPSYRPPRR